MKALLALSVLLALGGCGESMDNQNRMKTYGSSKGVSAWPSESEELPLVKGTIAQGALERERETRQPPPVTLSLLHRGRERYDIYCAPCHGLTGAGDGIVVARGFPRPKPLTDAHIMGAIGSDLVDVISQGSGVMYSFSDRVDPKDRWAIVAYIRSLQLASKGRKGAP